MEGKYISTSAAAESQTFPGEDQNLVTKLAVVFFFPHTFSRLSPFPCNDCRLFSFSRPICTNIISSAAAAAAALDFPCYNISALSSSRNCSELVNDLRRSDFQWHQWWVDCLSFTIFAEWLPLLCYRVNPRPNRRHLLFPTICNVFREKKKRKLLQQVNAVFKTYQCQQTC